MTEYAERPIDSDELCNHYARHVNAMTAEDLHSKSAIAGELAWRDARIEALEIDHLIELTWRDTRIEKLESKLSEIGRLNPTDYDDREQLLGALFRILRGIDEGGE